MLTRSSGGMIGTREAMTLVCVRRWKSVIRSLPRFPNSGMSSDTGIMSRRSPRSMRFSTIVFVNCLPTDIVANTASDSSRLPLARSAKPRVAESATWSPRVTRIAAPS